MSGPRFSIIPAWIVTDRRLKGRDLQVLCVLGRHVDENGWCTRSQVKLAGELGCARSTVQASLDRLKTIGVVQVRENETPDGRDCSHDYRILFDAEIVPQTIAQATENGDRESAGNDESTPCRYTGTPADISAPPADPESAPYKNVPLKNEERERASADGEGEGEGGTDEPMADDRRALRALKVAHPRWPTFATDSEVNTRREFLANSPADRAEGLARFPAYVAHATGTLGREKLCAFSTYWRDRLWKRLPADADPGVVEAPGLAVVPPFGPDWAAMRFAALLAGPQVTDFRLTPIEERMVETGAMERERILADKRLRHGWPAVNALDRAAGEGRPRTVRQGDIPRGVECEPVPVGSDVFRAWERCHEERGWPWIPAPGRMAVVWFPKGGPEGLDGFQRAVSAAGQQEAAE